MSDIPDTNDINKLAAWFDKDTLELIGHILNKHTKACLSQMKELVIERKELKKRLDAAEARLDAGEALLNRMSMNLILSGYSPELDKNNPMNDWLGRVVEWKKARLECPKQEEVEGK